MLTDHTSLGALGDSFYEYLIKSWVITNKRDEQAKAMYDETMEVCTLLCAGSSVRHEEHLVLHFQVVYNKMIQRTRNGLWYVAEWRGSHLDHKMDHLACFVGKVLLAFC